MGRGDASSSAAAVDWSKVSPHLRGYYSKIYGADGGGGGGGRRPLPPTPDERRGDSRQCTNNSNSTVKNCCVSINSRKRMK